jgi:hypothetical protein
MRSVQWIQHKSRYSPHRSHYVAAHSACATVALAGVVPNLSAMHGPNVADHIALPAKVQFANPAAIRPFSVVHLHVCAKVKSSKHLAAAG